MRPWLWCCAGLCGCLFCALLSTALVFAILAWNEAQDSADLSQHHTAADCDDGNSCTLDTLLQRACENRPLPNGEVCTDLCLVGDGVCLSGQCTGVCVGNCINTADCPDIAKAPAGVLDKNCLFGACFYTNFSPPPPFFQATSETESFNKICKGSLSPLEPFRDCLDIHPIAPAVLPTEQINLLQCEYTFACAEVQKPIV